MKMNSNLKFSLFETNSVNFVVFNSPIVHTSDTSNTQLDELYYGIERFNISLIFRLCEAFYPADQINNCKIVDLEIVDGAFPSEDKIQQFLSIIKNEINIHQQQNSKATIGIHCRAGLGRAPIFAAIGLMNYSEYDSYCDIVNIIRDKIKGSINIVQLTGLSKYKPTKDKQKCSIM
jgi:protein tyrosine phosphatase type 4A